MSTIWRIVARADFKTLGDAAERLDESQLEPALSWSLFDEGDAARLDVLYASMPNTDRFRQTARLAPSIELHCGPMPEEDWVRLSLDGLKPVDAGPFTLFGAHDRDTIAADRIGIEIEAGPAFGTGHHGTTRGCLIALDAVIGAGRPPKTVFDLGCGSAILAIAAAKLMPEVEVLASDIDPEAIDESRQNCRKNDTPDIDLFVADGLDHAKLAGRQFDLILANILAGPLVDLSQGIADLLAPGGTVILSGLLSEQENWVRQAYESAGLTVERRPPLDGWETLIARKA